VVSIRLPSAPRSAIVSRALAITASAAAARLAQPLLVELLHLWWREQAAIPSGHPIGQRNSALIFFNHTNRVATNIFEPSRKFLEVRQRGGETHDLDAMREVDEDLFPGGTPLLIVEEVNLIDDDGSEFWELLSGEEHVAKDLSGHHPAGGVPPNDEITGDEADVFFTDEFAIVSKLLIGEGLDGSSVDDLFSVGEAALDEPVCDHGLASAGGRADEHALAFNEAFDGLSLEPIQLKSAIMHLVLSSSTCAWRSDLA